MEYAGNGADNAENAVYRRRQKKPPCVMAQHKTYQFFFEFPVHGAAAVCKRLRLGSGFFKGKSRQHSAYGGSVIFIENRHAEGTLVNRRLLYAGL